MIPQVCAAMMGTIAFSLLFGVPRKYYIWCGLIGGAGWAVYVQKCPYLLAEKPPKQSLPLFLT